MGGRGYDRSPHSYWIKIFAVSFGMGTAAYYLRRSRFIEEASVMLGMGLDLASVLVPLKAVLGDLHGLNTLHYQPQKLAAIEGLWETRRGQYGAVCDSR